jgi:hypothetical protein
MKSKIHRFIPEERSVFPRLVRGGIGLRKKVGKKKYVILPKVLYLDQHAPETLVADTAPPCGAIRRRLPLAA